MAKKEIKRGSYLYPMPVVIVGSNNGGRANFMTAAYCGMMNIKPPIVALGLAISHFTIAGIKENSTFSVNIPSSSLMKATDYCGIVSGNDVDKSDVFKVFYGHLGTAPMVGECPLTMECKLVSITEFQPDALVVGEIMAAYCEEDCLGEKLPDIDKIDPMLYSMGDNTYRSVGKKLGTAWHAGKGYR